MYGIAQNVNPLCQVRDIGRLTRELEKRLMSDVW